MTAEIDYLVKISHPIWQKGTHEQKRRMVKDAIERARILHGLGKENGLPKQ